MMAASSRCRRHRSTLDARGTASRSARVLAILLACAIMVTGGAALSATAQAAEGGGAVRVVDRALSGFAVRHPVGAVDAGGVSAAVRGPSASMAPADGSVVAPGTGTGLRDARSDDSRGAGSVSSSADTEHPDEAKTDEGRPFAIAAIVLLAVGLGLGIPGLILSRRPGRLPKRRPDRPLDE